MAEKEKVNSEAIPTDADLEAAASGVEDKKEVEKEVSDEAPEEEVIDEETIEEELPPDNAERSRLGRKIKTLMEEAETNKKAMSEMLAEMRRMTDTIKELKSAKTETREEEPEDDSPDFNDDDTLLTVGEIKKFMEAREKKIAQESKKLESKKQEEEANKLAKYQTEYARIFYDLGKDDPDFNEIVKLVQEDAELNQIDTWVPKADAKLNYRAAKDKLNEIKAKNKRVVKTGATDTGLPKGVSSDSRSLQKKSNVVELDKYAKEFISKVGLGDEEVEEALSGDIRLNLMGNR